MVRFSLGYVAVCEFLLGALFAFYFLFDCALIARPYGHTHTHEIVVGLLFTASFTLLCSSSALCLLRGSSWSWFAAWFLGLLVLALGVVAIYDAFHPSPKSPDGYFGVLYGPPLILVSGVGLVLLSLPGTRRFVLHQEQVPSP